MLVWALRLSWAAEAGDNNKVNTKLRRKKKMIGERYCVDFIFDLFVGKSEQLNGFMYVCEIAVNSE